MATTVVMPPTNTESYASKFVPRLDELYKRGSLTAILDTPEDLVNWIGAKTVNLFTFSSVGMANYDRNAGYVMGDVNAGWEPFTLEIDRGRGYQVDSQSNDETLGMELSSMLSETERVELIPEIDAYCFAKMAGTTGISSATGALSTSADVIAAIDTAEAKMDNDEVPYEGRILFVSPAIYMKLKGGIERRIINSEDNVNTNVEFYDDMRIVRVPASRFNTAITLNAPTTSAGVGGYTATGTAIDFLIVHPSAVMKVIKHRVSNVFSPAQNIEADAFRVNFRCYYDLFVKGNKKAGIYLHTAS
jgi:hypothetical protein